MRICALLLYAIIISCLNMSHLTFWFCRDGCLLKTSNIPVVWYLFLSCFLLLVNKLDSNCLSQKDPKRQIRRHPDLFAIGYFMGRVESLWDDFIRPLLYLLEPFPNTYHYAKFFQTLSVSLIDLYGLVFRYTLHAFFF